MLDMAIRARVCSPGLFPGLESYLFSAESNRVIAAPLPSSVTVQVSPCCILTYEREMALQAKGRVGPVSPGDLLSSPAPDRTAGRDWSQSFDGDRCV